MAEQVHLPGVGGLDKRWVIAAGAAAAGVVGFAYWRRGQAGSAAGDQAVPDDMSWADGQGQGVADGSPWPFQPAPATGGTVTDPGQLPPSTNAEWTVRAIERMGDVGYEPATVVLVLGKYLARQPLTPSEVDIVRAATAMLGPPPIGTFPIIGLPATPVGGGSAGKNYRYGVKLSRLTAQESGRHLVQRFSDASVATPSTVAVALTQTARDPANAKYLPYFMSHGGAFPAGAAVQTHVVLKAA